MGLDLLTGAGNQEAWKFGTTERATRGTPIALFATCRRVAATPVYCTFRQQRAAGGYQVTAGKTLIITRLIYAAEVAGTVWSIIDGSDAVAADSAVAPTGEQAVDATASIADANPLIPDVANKTYEISYYAAIPAGRFPAIRNDTATSRLRVIALGYEV